MSKENSRFKPMELPEESLCCFYENAKSNSFPVEFSFETIKEYGDEFEGNVTHKWEEGERSLLRCRKCGRYTLYMKSITSDWIDDRDVTETVFLPALNEEEAEFFNRNYAGGTLEDIKRIKLIQMGSSFWWR